MPLHSSKPTVPQGWFPKVELIDAGCTIGRRRLDYAGGTQAGVAVAADHQIIVQHDAEWGGGLFDNLRRGNVGLGQGRVARWMVVHQYQRRGAQFERTLDNLAGVDRHVVNSSLLLVLVFDPHIFAVVKQDVEFLDRVVRDVGTHYDTARRSIPISPSSLLTLGWSLGNIVQRKF